MIEARTLGDYSIIKQVGQGSMGAVYLAEHRFMKKQYILKVLPEELATDRGFIQRFEEDVGILATLDHPHIVKIHTVSFAQGSYFLVTDCVVDEFGETTNLAQYMLSRGKRFDEETLYRLLRQIAEALDYAHTKKVNGKGIFHRNLKLNNILVAKGRGGIDLMISDFGLTRIIGTGALLTRTYRYVAEALGIGSALYTSVGQDRYPNPPIDNQKLTPLHASFIQNYAFLAPEQKRLDTTYPVDGKVDVYAFGILVYYLLMGEFPEGLFNMPSKAFPDSKWHWDSLITACLQTDPTNRPELLVPLLDAVRQHAKGILPKEISPLTKVEPIVQPVFVQPTFEAVAEVSQPYTPPPAPQPSAHQFSGHTFTTVTPAPTNMLDLEALQEAVRQVEAPAPTPTPAPTPALAVAPAPAPAPAPQATQAPAPQANLKPIIRSTQIERPVHDLDPGSVFLIDTTVKHYTPEPKEDKNIQPLQSEMIVISGGSFFRGSNDGNRDEMPRHQVIIESFAIDIHPVTNEQFVRFLEVMGGEKDSNHQDIIRMRDSRIKRSGGKLSIESGYAKHPVVGVTWYGAIAYAKWVGKRLPTEAEWEIAARGGNETALYPTGDDIEKTQANFFSFDTTAVMSYAPNDAGLYDMAGNVYEWCHDWYGYNYYESSVQEPENPKGPLQGVYRVLRGGCWKSLKEDLRCSRRHRNNPGTVNGTYGFRCAADVQ